MLVAMVVLVMGVIVVGAADTLVLRNGRRAECEVLGFSADAVRIRRGGEEQRDVRLADVDYVEFGELAGEVLSRIAISEPTRPDKIAYAVCSL